MNFKKRFILLLVMLFIIAGCSNSGEVNESKSDDQTKEKTLVYGIVGEIQRLDPVLASEKNAFALSSSVFNALVRFPIGTTDVEAIEGDLAEKWESNDDNTQWTFYLREGVQWHQGYGEFTSEDVKYSFERVMDPESGSPYGKDYSHVEKIETPDPYTVVFHLNSQDPNFLLKNITQGGKIVNKEAVEDGKPEIGTGPFMVEKLHTGDRVELVKHPEYFRGEPKLDKVVYKFMKDITAIEIALDSGEIHMAAGLSEPTWIEKTKQKDHIITEFAGLNMVYAYMLDMTTPPFDDIRVRQAIAHAIDVEGYVQNMVGEDAGVIPKGGPIPSDVFGAANVGLYEYDPEKSKKLLAEAGYENGLTLPTQYMSTLPSFLEKALYVQEQLRQVGIELPWEQVEHATYHANVKQGLNQIVMLGLTSLTHADVLLSRAFHSSTATAGASPDINYTNYDKIDSFIEDARIEPDQEKALQLYQEAQEQIKEDYVIIPMLEGKLVFVRSDKVDLGYNNNKMESTLTYSYHINENTDLEQ